MPYGLGVDHHLPHLVDLCWLERVPDLPPDDFGGAVLAQALAGAVEAHRASLRVEHQHESPHAVGGLVEEVLPVG